MAAKVKAKVVNIDKWLGDNKPFNRVKALGIELEGGWKTLPPGARLEGDASVFHNAPQPGLRQGELQLGPFLLADLNKYMKKYYPSKVDETCGLHVHMSFESPLHYGLLADSPDYQETVLEYLYRWAKENHLPEKHCIWDRLSGKSVYCQKEFWPYAQMTQARKDYDKARHGHRYTVIHYCHERNGTVECRVLPMMDNVDLGISAVRRLVDITNAYLYAADKHKVKEGGQVVLSDGAVYEEVLEIKL